MATSYCEYLKQISAKYLVNFFDTVDNSEKILKKLAQKGENVITLGTRGNQVLNEELTYNENCKKNNDTEDIMNNIKKLDTLQIEQIKQKLATMENDNVKKK